LLAQRNQTLALKAQAQANLAQSEAKFSFRSEWELKVLEINLDRAKEDMTRAKNQSEGGVITPEQFDHIKKAFETASAQLDASRAQLLVSKSMIFKCVGILLRRPIPRSKYLMRSLKIQDFMLRQTAS